MSTTEQPTKWSLSLSDAERTELLALLERESREIHVEARRTESPDYQAAVHQKETVIQGLIDKLRRA